MNKSKIILAFLSGFITLLTVSSCHREDSNDEVLSLSTESRKRDLNSIYEDRVRFSKAFSKAIQNSEFYNFVLQECVKSKLTDPEILYAQYYDKVVNDSGITFGSYLASMENNYGVSVSSSLTFFNSSCVLNDPLLGIVLMPGRNNDYSTLGQIENSKKVYIDKIFDEFTESEHISYSINGITSSHLYGDEPLEPYFAIKHNEEYIAYDLISEEIFYNEPFTLTTCGGYVRYEDVKSPEARIITLGNTAIADKGYNSEISDGNLETRSCDKACMRDCLDGKDAITRIKFNHDYEGWPKGGPEFIMQYAIGLNETVTTNPYGFVLSKSFRNSYNLHGNENMWYDKNRKGTRLREIQLFNWSSTRHTYEMMQLWTEDDGKFKNYNLGFTLGAKVKIDSVDQNIGVSFSTVFSAGDEEIGTVIVQYCDNWSDIWGYQYIVAGPSGDVFFTQLERGY